MKVTVEHLPQRQVVLNIEADADEVEKSRQVAYRHLVNRARVPGFRMGKAPMAMLERYTGKSVFMEEAMHHLVPEATGKAIEEQGIEAAGQPEIEIMDTEPISWKATVDLAPTVDLKGYRDIRIPLEPVKVSRAEIAEALEEIRFSQAPWEPVQRKSLIGDLLTVDIYAERDGQQVADDQGVQYRLVEGSQAPVPGFAEQLVGLKSGETKEFALSAPEDSEHEEHEGHEEHAGKEYRFRVVVTDIKGKTTPALDDEFAKGVGDGFDTVEALRRHVKGQISQGKEREAKDALQEKALQAVIDGASVEYSPSLALHEAEHMVQEQEERLGRNRLSLDEYLQSVGKSREELVEEGMPAAEERVVRSLVVTELREREGIDVTDEEAEGEIKALMGDGSQESEALRRFFQSEQGHQSLRRSLLTRKTLDGLVEIVTQSAGKPASKPKKETASNDQPAE